MTGTDPVLTISNLSRITAAAANNAAAPALNATLNNWAGLEDRVDADDMLELAVNVMSQQDFLNTGELRVLKVLIARDILRIVSLRVIEGVADRPPLSSDLLDLGRVTVYKV